MILKGQILFDLRRTLYELQEVMEKPMNAAQRKLAQSHESWLKDALLHDDPDGSVIAGNLKLLREFLQELGV